MTYKSEYLRTLDRRGFLHQLTDAQAIDGRALAMEQANRSR